MDDYNQALWDAKQLSLYLRDKIGGFIDISELNGQSYKEEDIMLYVSLLKWLEDK